MKCNHCGEDLGDGDAYDLMEAHLPYCNSKVAIQCREALNNEEEDLE